MYKRFVHVKKSDFIVYETQRQVDEIDSPEKVGKDDALATYGFIAHEFSRVLGKVLTLVDASISEPRQNKAIKDLIKTTFSDEYGFLSDMLIDQKAVDRAANLAAENGTLREASIEEALGLE